ncbi:MAG TPA: TIGR00730 family Rossman fold protein [Planctomycetota bacterium]|nr:TIGR00730 family Rossman fold protein [Planctomycetota bacterium]
MKSICVYCGSRSGNDPAFAKLAETVGEALLERNLRLVYGGGKVGLMGLVADSVLRGGGEVIGVIPDALVQQEVAHQGLTQLFVTRSMHERKTLMATLSDGFLALSGGIGTLEEVFEIWTWSYLGYHQKPLGLVNAAGYFDSLIDFLRHAGDQGFVQGSQKDMLLVDQDPRSVLDRFDSYVPPPSLASLRKGQI